MGFKSYSKFNESLVVEVDDVAGMDEFLTEELKQFFEKSNIDHIESSGESILISPDQFPVAPLHEYSKIFKMLENLRKLIASN